MQDLETKLEASTIRSTVLRAGMFLTGWELLKAEAQDAVESFFENTPRYRTEVLSLASHPFDASVLWLVRQNALTADQGARATALRRHRNEVAHELPKLLVDPAHDVNSALLREMAAMLHSLAIFWGRISIEADERFDRLEVRDEDIQSGACLLMAYVIASCEDAK